MKKQSLFVAAMMMLVTNSVIAQSNNNQDEVVKIDHHNQHAYREGEVLVKFKAQSGIVQSGARSVNASGVNSVLSSLGVTELEQLMPLTGEAQLPATRAINGKFVNEVDLSNLYRVRFDATKIPSVHTAIENMKSLSEVEFAEPNYVVYKLSTDSEVAGADDPLKSEQWGHGQLKLDFLQKQKPITTKRPVIAILDTGVDITHPDLVDNIWTNTLEAEGEEEADDDNNGFADDLHGWDFVNQTGRIGDWNGHGTHCAGIAAAVKNNGKGITGANPDALIMPITVMQSDGTGDVATIIKGIDYAVANGADILSMSFGGYTYSNAEEQALAKAYSKAVLVAAAGNDYKCIYAHGCPINKNLPLQNGPMYPAAFTFVLGVEAGMQDGSLASFSNFDEDGPVFSQYNENQLYNYELRGPGVSIMSTYPGGKYKKLNGTSMACPYVAGGISLLLQRKGYSSWEVLFGDLIHTRKQNGNGNVDFEAAYNITDEDRIPELGLVTYTLKDTIEGDRDGKADAGETIAFYPTLRNEWGQAKNIKFSLELAETEDPTIVEILDKNVDFGKQLSSYAKNISANPIRFKVNENCVDGRHICMVLRATCDNIAEDLVYKFTITSENGVEIGGMIMEDMTLYPNVHYIVTKSIAIPSGITLTILPGTVLRFKDNTGLNAVGTLVCQGTPDQPIVFTQAELSTGKVESFRFYSNIVEYVKFMNLYMSHNLIESGNIKNCLICNVNGSSLFNGTGIYNSSIFSNDGGTISHIADVINSNVIGNNRGYTNIENVKNSNLYGNRRDNGDLVSCQYNSSSPVILTQDNPSYFGSSCKNIVQNWVYDFNNPISPLGYGVLNLSNMLTRPSSEAHGIVWKVVVNGYDAQDEFEQLPPLGVGRHKFEVYFNRPMDVNITPMIAMGVRPPYTSHTIAEEGSWNEERTIYTAYLTITGKTGADGLNRIYVADAVESFENYYIRKELQQLAEKTDSLLQKVANVSEKVTFQTSDDSKEGYLTGLSFYNLEALFDGSTSEEAYYRNGYGHLCVDLGTFKSAALIRFYYITRTSTTNSIVVQGRNDGSTYDDINVFSSSDAINPLPMGYYEDSWQSPLINAGTSYRYYRFVLNGTGNSYFSEFGMDILNPSIKDNYISLITSDEAIEIYRNIVSANVLCDNENIDCNLLQTTLDKMYADYNKLAAILGEPLIDPMPVEVPSASEWVIPIENIRFNVQVAAAGSMATGLMAEAGLGKVTLTWETDEEDFEDLLGYNIMRYTDHLDSVYVKDYNKYGDYKEHLEVTGDTTIINPSVIESSETSFVDYDVVPGTTYYYVIKQLTTSLSSHALSNAVAATPLTAQKGDANGSMNVDIADVVTEIAYMTNQAPQPFIYEAADVNSDLNVNILDVVGTLNIILNPTSTGVASVNNTATYTVENGILYVDSPVALGGVQVRIAAAKGTEFTALEGLDGFEQTGNWQSDDEYLFLAYSMVGRTICAGKQALLRIGDDVTISQVVLSDPRGKNVLAINGNATGIGAVETMQMTLPYPNPFSTELHIPYVIGKEGNHQVNIVISDLAGRTVYRHSETCGFGEYAHTWTPAGNLANGLYLVSLYVDGTLMHTAKALKN